MIWKALSDPTRRKILSLLKNAPQTTGELSDQFKENLSRFAIMKHLGILEKAQLITTKKEGKFRWNYLNAKPIQEQYDQWVNNLIQLKYYTEHTSVDMSNKEQRIATTKIEMEVSIKASKIKVWRALTMEIGKWWSKDFYTSTTTQDFVLETRLGGLMYEDTGNDEGAIWATVIGIQAPNHIMLKGNLSPEFGGPAISFLKITLTEKGKSTLLRLEDSLMGAISEELQQRLTQSWNQLFGKALKGFVEKQK